MTSIMNIGIAFARQLTVSSFLASKTRTYSVACALFLTSKINLLHGSDTIQDTFCDSYSTSCTNGDGNRWTAPQSSQKPGKKNENVKSIFTEDELRSKLSSLQYRVTQEGDTERAFSGVYYNHKETGFYNCVVCGAALFSSSSKYDSGSGWPSFFQPVNKDSITQIKDTSHGMIRTEVRCKQCGSHLGHLFDDGPPPTGVRYCVNSASLHFKKHQEF